MSVASKATLTSGNFRRLKQGRTDDYQIKQYESRVVADNFKFGADKNIIVALEHNVLMASKKDLLKVTCSKTPLPQCR